MKSCPLQEDASSSSGSEYEDLEMSLDDSEYFGDDPVDPDDQDDSSSLEDDWDSDNNDNPQKTSSSAKKTGSKQKKGRKANKADAKDSNYLLSTSVLYGVDPEADEILYEGNIHPPEYYRQAVQQLDEGTYTRKVYAEATERQILSVERQWRQYCENCMFRLAFERALACKIDGFVDRRVALAELQKKHNLTHVTRVNRSMTLNDLKLQIETTLRTSEKVFKLGELRILAVLFLLLLALAGSRLFLLFSPYVFLLGILFRHRAFRSKLFNNHPHTLAELDIHQGEYKLPLSLRPELDDVFIFRQAAQTMLGNYELSDDPITLPMMSGWVKRIGELSGFEHTTVAYTLRYMAGNNMDRNVNISDSMRNLVMDHTPGSDTFQTHYLNRNVCADLWAIHRDQEPQQELIVQATSHGHSRSSRRPIALTLEQSAALDNHPTLVRKTRAIKDLHLRAFKAKLYNAEKKRLSQAWTEEQGVKDVDWQIQGNTIGQFSQPSLKAAPSGWSVFQERLVEALTAPLTSDLDAQYKRRANAIDLIVSYCHVDELPSTKMVIITSVGEKLKRCFLFGKALRLSPDDPNFNTYCRSFHGTTDVTRHFYRKHLRHMGPNDKSTCPICILAITMNYMQHLQVHALLVHGVKSPRTT
ncbi:C2H2 finger domain protein [Xylaria telfairii]|nr:C2H2 finger domain protein [Xylaria telfairii]